LLRFGHELPIQLANFHLIVVIRLRLLLHNIVNNKDLRRSTYQRSERYGPCLSVHLNSTAASVQADDSAASEQTPRVYSTVEYEVGFDGRPTVSLNPPAETTSVELPIKPGIAVIVNDGETLGPELSILDAEMTEMALLLPRWQALALHSAARQRGLTTAQMLRRMITAIVGVQPPRPVG
jgi:hypothetical protein